MLPQNPAIIETLESCDGKEEEMSEKRFSVPVAVRLGIAGQRMIYSTWEAVECLKIHWPRNHGPKYRKALQSCMDALDGWKPAHKARRAFVDAAREAGIFLEVKPQH
ncbi:DUF982 domain-containing protein [uncultured Phyllobacterium sp.]|nr:DUF982 domain-containing protein [uncultured Phyllobacterium sp.]